MNLDYIPNQDSELITWLKNYKKKIAVVGPQIGLADDDIAHEQNLCDSMINKITEVQIARNNLCSNVNAKQNYIGELRTRIANHKTNKTFDITLQQQLGIANPKNNLELSNNKSP